MPDGDIQKAALPGQSGGGIWKATAGTAEIQNMRRSGDMRYLCSILPSVRESGCAFGINKKTGGIEL